MSLSHNPNDAERSLYIRGAKDRLNSGKPQPSTPYQSTSVKAHLIFKLRGSPWFISPIRGFLSRVRLPILLIFVLNTNPVLIDKIKQFLPCWKLAIRLWTARLEEISTLSPG